MPLLWRSHKTVALQFVLSTQKKDGCSSFQKQHWRWITSDPDMIWYLRHSTSDGSSPMCPERLFCGRLILQSRALLKQRLDDSCLGEPANLPCLPFQRSFGSLRPRGELRLWRYPESHDYQTCMWMALDDIHQQCDDAACEINPSGSYDQCLHCVAYLGSLHTMYCSSV